MNRSRTLITGVLRGVRVEEIDEPGMRAGVKVVLEQNPRRGIVRDECRVGLEQ